MGLLRRKLRKSLQKCRLLPVTIAVERTQSFQGHDHYGETQEFCREGLPSNPVPLLLEPQNRFKAGDAPVSPSSSNTTEQHWSGVEASLSCINDRLRNESV